MESPQEIIVGVLALQGAFNEHIQLLRQATQILAARYTSEISWELLEVRTVNELNKCDGLIIPGGESTAISLIAERCGMLEPLRDFIKVSRKPTWGTCAGLILLAESANKTKKGGQELLGGLDIRVNRNHFGRQIESFQADLDFPFLAEVGEEMKTHPFRAVFIRAPIVEKILPTVKGIQEGEAEVEETVVAPSRVLGEGVDEKVLSAPVDILSTLPGRTATFKDDITNGKLDAEAGDIVAVRQANVFGTSFHPELTGDARIHVWWLKQVVDAVQAR